MGEGCQRVVKHALVARVAGVNLTGHEECHHHRHMKLAGQEGGTTAWAGGAENMDTDTDTCVISCSMINGEFSKKS